MLRAVLFTDVVGSTELARELGDERWSRLLEAQRRIVREQLRTNRGREVDTAGDGFFAVFDGPADAVRCAFAAARKVQDIGLDIRAGVHFGEIETSGNDAHGIVVHTGARVMSKAGAAEVLITQTVKELVAGARFEVAERGVFDLKGVPGTWTLFDVVAVEDEARPDSVETEGGAERRDRATVAEPARRSRRWIALTAAALLIAAAIGGFLLTRNGGTVVPGVNTVAEIPAGGDGFSREIDAGGTPDGVAAGEGAIWVINQADGTVQRIDPSTADPIIATKSTLGPPTGVAAGEGYAWITTGFGTAGGGGTGALYRFDPSTNDVMKVPGVPGGKAIAVGDGSIWIADDVNDRVIRIDPKTNDVATIKVGAQPVAIAVGPGSQSPVWIANAVDHTVSRIDPSTNRAEPFDVKTAPSGIAVDAKGNVWVTSAIANTVTRLDATGHAVSTIGGVPTGPTAVVAAGDAVWVGAVAGHAVVRIDPATNNVIETLAVSGSPSSLAIDPEGNLWVTVRAE